MNKPTVANKLVRDILHRNIVRSARNTNTTTIDGENLEWEKGKDPELVQCLIWLEQTYPIEILDFFFFLPISHNFHFHGLTRGLSVETK